MIVYLRNNKDSWSKKAYKGAFYLSIIALIIIIFKFGQGFLERTSHYLLDPVIENSQVVSSAISSQTIKSKSKLLEEISRLKGELDFKEATILKYEYLQNENERLRGLLGRSEEKSVLLSKILSKPNLSPYDTLIIDVGENNALSPGLLVLGGDSTPIGRIAEVYKETSLVRLFSSPLEKQTVEIGESGILGEAIGAGGGNFRVLLPKDVPVDQGDLIRIPGIDSNILGVVDLIDKRETETFIKIIFSSPLNIYQLKEVLVVL